MQRLPQRPPVLEDELGEKAVDILTEQVTEQVTETWIVGQVRIDTRLVVEAEHLPDLLLGKGRRGVRDRFEEHLGVAHVTSRASSPTDRHRPFPEGGARRSVGESGNDDKAVALPRLPFEGGQGRHSPPP